MKKKGLTDFANANKKSYFPNLLICKTEDVETHDN